MRPPVTSLVIQTWKDQGRPKPWKQYGRGSSSPDSTDSDTGPSEDDRWRRLPQRFKEGDTQPHVSVAWHEPKAQQGALSQKEHHVKERDCSPADGTRLVTRGARHSDGLLVRSQSVDSGLHLSCRAYHGKTHVLRHEGRKHNTLGRHFHDRNHWHHVASHIHHNQMDGFAHPPPYPKHRVWHRSNSLGGEIASPLTERLPRSSSHTDGLIYTERRLHSIPRSRSMDADLVYSRASPLLDNERLNGHAPSGSFESLLTIPTCRIGQKLTLQRSQSMDDGLTAVFRSDCQRIHISKEFVSRRRMQILENIAEHSPSRTDEELQEDGRLQETTSNGDRATVFARDE
ncbi:hypothetical protein CCYA_CCYA14G3778 [Cyanidiococcus yangmingshanensis]|nr:hypothetical protein CCYA_CCYA14G3778 [Cyanidiococcus yangmingshanensis]